MKLLCYLFLAAYTIGCSQNSAVTQKLRGCDSLVINFFAPNSDSIIRTVATSEKKAIDRLADFVSAEETELFKCGYDGSLHFFEKGKMVSDVSFKFSVEGCQHFILDAEGKLTSTTMSKEAADFLSSLKAGREIYW